MPKRLEFSRLAAFRTTEIGPLNQLIHVWEYENLVERARIRAEVVKAGIWPPQTQEFIIEMKSGYPGAAAVLAAARSVQPRPLV